jgi:phospholipid/cholesterol/gamma-HCH transport system ATP-binding protein
MAPDKQIPVLRFDRVSVAFDDTPALADVSFQAYEGESRVIMGATGSGKTVLLKTALGLQRPDSGTVYVFGKDISRMRERELFEIRGKMGMLFQESALFDSLNIEENVSYPLLNQLSIHCPPEEVLPRVEEALKFVELEGILEKFPSELSGGMRRRAAIARAVVTQPPLLLYDSPTAGLDPITANTIVALIVKERDLNQTTTLIVTYRYQDGNLVANFRYNPENGGLEPAAGHSGSQSGSHSGGHSGSQSGAAPRTLFMVLREGRLIFEGPQTDLEASQDPYISKFVKHRE